MGPWDTSSGLKRRTRGLGGGVGEGGGNGVEESVGQRREPGGDRGDRWCRGNAPGAARAPEPGKATAEDIRALYNLTNIAEGKAAVRAIGDRQVGRRCRKELPRRRDDTGGEWKFD
jgi:hypothetical protein